MFSIISQDKRARAGVLETLHGRVKTPFFMPVATKASVKNISSCELRELDIGAVISNAFILYLQPGLEIIENHGGLHKFMDYEGTVFTDCGGFQVLLDRFFEKTTYEGVHFKSPFDGQRHILTPEKSLDIQLRLGSDAAMCLDVCLPYGLTERDYSNAIKTTHNWAKRTNQPEKSLLFGICQGGTFPELRKESAVFMDSNFDYVAIGGLAIGEPKEKTREMIEICRSNVGYEKPLYFMGLGSPADVVDAVYRGVDIFDSCYPARNARHNSIFTSMGEIKINKGRYKEDFGPLDSECACVVCARYSRSYINYLGKINEPLAYRYKTYHNLFFMNTLMQNIREAIAAGCFEQFKENFLKNYQKKKTDA